MGDLNVGAPLGAAQKVGIHCSGGAPIEVALFWVLSISHITSEELEMA